jgi:ABC-type multidrug transport system ATPase subunit
VELGDRDGGGGTPALEATGLVKSWRSVRVLDGADLAVNPGERVWIGGRNGAGKTTLLRIAAGLILPEAGTIRLHGLDPERDRQEFQHKLGFLSAGNSGLFARLTVRDNLEYTAGIALVPRSRRRHAIDATIERLGIGHLAPHRVDRLSMGQRQRVRIAGSLLHDPPMLMFDEPETSLDDEGLSAVRELLQEHAAGGGTALICSPSHEKVALDIDRAFVLDGGRLVPE